MKLATFCRRSGTHPIRRRHRRAAGDNEEFTRRGTRCIFFAAIESPTKMCTMRAEGSGEVGPRDDNTCMVHTTQEAVCGGFLKRTRNTTLRHEWDEGRVTIIMRAPLVGQGQVRVVTPGGRTETPRRLTGAPTCRHAIDMSMRHADWWEPTASRCIGGCGCQPEMGHNRVSATTAKPCSNWFNVDGRLAQKSTVAFAAVDIDG